MDNGGLIIDNGDVPVVSYQFPLFFIINYLLSIINYEKAWFTFSCMFRFCNDFCSAEQYCEKPGT